MFDVSKYALASSERLLNMFHEGFNVVDLAQPLRSLDIGTDIEDAGKLMKKEGVPVLGIRRSGRIAGYVLPEDLNGDECYLGGRTDISEWRLEEPDIPRPS
jgi:hypothetical protein